MEQKCRYSHWGKVSKTKSNEPQKSLHRGQPRHSLLPSYSVTPARTTLQKRQICLEHRVALSRDYVGATLKNYLGYKQQDALDPTLPCYLKKRWPIKATSPTTIPPFSPEHAIRNFKKYLTCYEQKEIQDFRQVWYVGKHARKIHGSKTLLSFNSGYDTKEGLYRAIINDHLAYRYQILKVIGQGFSGQVLQCIDHKPKQLVAVKVFRINGNHQDPLPEEDILKAVKDFDKDNSDRNIHMKEKFTFRSHLCITFEISLEDPYGLNDQDKVVEEELEKYTADMLEWLQQLKEKNEQGHVEQRDSPSQDNAADPKSKTKNKNGVQPGQQATVQPSTPKAPQKPQLDLGCKKQAAVNGSQQKNPAEPLHSQSVRSTNVGCLKKLWTFNRPCATAKPPFTPGHVLATFKRYLTKYEQEEVLKQKLVWYFRKESSKFRDLQFFPQSSDHGNDTEEGFYRVIINDHLAYRYQIIKVIGQGYSGQVLKCMDHKTSQLVAVKVFRNKDSCREEALSEVRMLQAVREFDKEKSANIVHMKERFIFRKHLCITFELFNENLKNVNSRKKGQLSEQELKKYTMDMLKCLQLLREKCIVHGDLKPENVLICEHDDEKHAAVADFGASYFVREHNQPWMYTRYYSPPELFLHKRCHPALDMWSLGCTIAELYRGHRLFEGSDNQSVFCRIMEVLGVPDFKLLIGAPRKTNFFDSNGLPYKLEEIKQHRTTLAQKLHSRNLNFINFIGRCLEYDPKKRMTPEEAFQHPWILHAKLQSDVLEQINLH